MLQSNEELENWYSEDDPWKYKDHPDDKKRKQILFSEIPTRKYINVLDIGCGEGFITRELTGEKVTSVDISHQAIKKAKVYENAKLKFKQCSLFELNNQLNEKYDLIIITGVLYPQYIGNSLRLIYNIVDKLLIDNGILVSVHIDSWYKAKFPYLLLNEDYYTYREYTHKLEVYIK